MLEQLSIQRAGARVTVLGDLNDKEYPYYNPCIAYDGDGKLRIAIRSCNFTVKPRGAWRLADGGSYATTRILYGYLDPDTLKVSDLKQLRFGNDAPFETREIAGLEDARLFWRDDGMHFSGVEIDTRREYLRPALQAEYVLDEKTGMLKHIKTMRLFTIARPEKNWLPTDKPGKFAYSYSPTEVYKDGEVYLVGEQPYSGYIHGSSQLLWQPDRKKYLAVLHSKHVNPLAGPVYDNHVYLHYWAEYSDSGVLEKISDPFTFGTGNQIEFAAGMVEVDGDLLISFGIGDAMMGMARLNKKVAQNSLHVYTGNEQLPDGIFDKDEAQLLLQLKRQYDREQRSRLLRR